MRSVMREPQTAALLLAVLLLGAREPAAERVKGPTGGSEANAPSGTLVFVACIPGRGEVAGAATAVCHGRIRPAATSEQQGTSGAFPGALLPCLPDPAGSESADPRVAAGGPARGTPTE